MFNSLCKLTVTTILSITAFSIPIIANAKNNSLDSQLQNLEKRFNGRIGVYAINTNNNQIIAYRADERFPMQSTLKLVGVAALLKKSSEDKNLLQEKLFYSKNELSSWHPVTGRYVNKGITWEALAEAAITYSDNPAINFIIKKLGGPQFITHFAHSIGNETFNLKHYEGNLNTNPKYQDDSSTPKGMAIIVENLTLKNVLEPSQRAQLIAWMTNSTTSNKRIRAGSPIAWVVADKTGSGSYGVANDIGIAWSPACKPIVLAIYTKRNKQEAESRDDIVAAVTKIIFAEFEKNELCFKDLA